ncbi:MAG: MopE-related protein [Kofleriaceae bacterium]
MRGWWLALGVVVAAPSARAECPALGPSLVEHSCFHARFGPFGEATAGTGDQPASGTLDAVHTYYRVRLGGAAASGAVPYTPARSGDWAFFVQHAVPLEIRAPNGEPLAIIHTGAVPGCPFFARVDVVPLVAGVTYQVALGPTPASEVGVVIERLEDFVAIHGRDRDGDGYGDPNDVVISACVPGAGYVANEGDCDDSDPGIHPGAIERCDNPDLNCNGIAGDAGARCTVGVGACAAAGTASCPVAEMAAVCDAAALAPEVERCNGIDDDCDGIADADEADLCADPELPRCVPDGTGASFCGCELDVDCGPPDSARLCWLRGTEQRCVAGCIEGFGRNACPDGQRCTSTDPAAPGSCVDADQAAAGDDGCGCRSARGGWGAIWLVVAIALRGLFRRAR